jgi:hypothetical protein
MDDCTAREVAIEMRAHGVLPHADEQDLLSHLESCAACRDFQNIVRRTETVMAHHAIERLDAVNWEALFQKTKQFVDQEARQRILRGIVVLVAMTAMVTLVTAETERVAAYAAIAGAAFLASIWIRSRLALRRLALNESNRGELFYLYRSELEAKLAAAHRAPVGLAFVVLFFFVTHSRIDSAQAWMGSFGVAAIAIGVAMHAWFVRRPRLRRELDALVSESK